MRSSWRSVGLLAFLLAGLVITSALGDAIPVIRRNAQEDGTVRVRLDTLGTGGVYTLTTTCVYTGREGSIPAGTKAVVRYVGGRFSLAFGGNTLDMGTEFTLERQGTGDGQGVKIAEAAASSNLYLGDLTFVSRNGVPYVVCHVFIEDYLDGVVSYEMSNAFPLEALKAQAITARTYAVRRMASASGNYYDLRDTTSDQVYRGTASGNANCKAAVDATAGMVLMYGDAYCAVYYSSSNGGQTESAEHAWGGSGFPYYTLKDDPYDLANPSSAVRRATVYASYAKNGQALRSYLEARLASQYGVSGAVSAIEGITPHSPRYGVPSRLYTKLRFDLRMADGSLYGVDAPVFGGVDGVLSMSMSGSQNELFTVESISGGYSIQARRYGHGVGLSQYGAQQMANQGLDYRSILGFYFEGASLVQHSFVSGAGAITVVAEAVSEDGVKATVSLSDAGDRLNLRSEPHTGATTLTRIPHGAEVTVLATENGWAKVGYGRDVGYVSARYLRYGTEEASSDSEGLTAVVVLDSGSLNLRQRESVASGIVATIPNGARVTVLGQGSLWCQVRYGDHVGFVMTAYLGFDRDAPIVKQESGPKLGVAVVQLKDVSSALNLRRSTEAGQEEVLLSIPHGAQVDVHAWGSVWSQVTYEGQDGYVATEFLREMDSMERTQETAVSRGDLAYISTQSGSGTVNLRAAMGVDAQVLAQIPHGAEVVVSSIQGQWALVQYAGQTGYVSVEFVSGGKYSEGADSGDLHGASGLPELVINLGKVSLESERSVLNLRATPNVESPVVYQGRHGDSVEVLAYVRGGEWARIRLGDVTGYAALDFLTLRYGLGIVRLSDASSTLALRQEPYADAPSLAKLAHGELLTLVEIGDVWHRVRAEGGLEGYVYGEYLLLK